jgi:cysteinyl-tRNA synthetase
VHIRYSEEPGAEVLYLVATRERARLEKDWLAADRLRDELQADGWAVEDTSEGPILSRR